MSDPLPDYVTACADEIHSIAVLLHCASEGLFGLTSETLAVLAAHLETVSRHLARAEMPPGLPGDLTRGPKVRH